MIKHLLAYGQSDQASFRDAAISACYDTMTLPGTIASYFEDATAAFVLTLKKPYFIDPRTPLFQDSLATPRPSHETLADWHGPSVAAQIAAGGHFPATFYTPAVVSEMVTELVDRQRTYGAKAAGVRPKMNRYLRLLAQARGQATPDEPEAPGPAPESVLLPYFAVNGLSSPWWSVMQEIWRVAAGLTEPSALRPVVCVGGADMALQDAVHLLDSVLGLRPSELSHELLFWITNFDERSAGQGALRRLWDVVEGRSAEGIRLTNVYGGFYSICLGMAGLDGFGNGLGYSESRQWPALDATGAAPARYYIRDLHLFTSQARAEQLVSREQAFLCPCWVCASARAAGRSIVALDYPDLKAHFALARAWERDLVDGSTPGGIARHLRSASALFQNTSLPPGVSIPVDHLLRWADVLDTVAP